MSTYAGEPAGSPRDPWFRRHPRTAVAVAGLLFAAVLSLRLFAADPVEASTLLFTLPVALVAVAFGLRAGVIAGGSAVVLIVLWVVTTDATLTPVGWISRLVPEILLGFLLGDASDRLRRAEDERRRLESAELLYREAIEINDSLVQGMAAARWALEAGRTDAGLKTLEDTIEQAQELVSNLIRQAGMAGRTSSLPPD
ncbi:hypothetical protein [Kribbella sp. NPDC000426]|uniref:hypothetical protein n=1 Tax=Kribbella sp. NPDC000426 TaxID=3154255 RepID=UPI003318AC1B